MDRSTTFQRICVVCQREISDEAKFCPHCGHNYSGPSNIEMGKKVGSIVPVVGGLSILVAGLINLANGIVTIMNTGLHPSNYSDAVGLLMLGGIVSFAAGIIGSLAGGLAMQRRNLVFSLAGGFVSLSSVGMSALAMSASLFMAPELALIGIVLIALSHEEFDRRD